jgi:hypothetical protein
MTTPKDGVYYDVPAREYRSWRGLNMSLLKAGLRSMRAMHHKANHYKAPSKAMVLGTAVHMAVLEPKLWEDMKKKDCVFDGNRTAKKAFAAFSEGKSFVLTQDEYDKACALRDVLLEDQDACHLLDTTKHEVSLIWTSKAYGRGKMRIDLCDEHGATFGDVKTARDIRLSTVSNLFQREDEAQAFKIQWGWFLEAAKHLFPKAGTPTGYILAVETGDVPDAYCAEVDWDVMEAGRIRAVEVAREYRVCQSLGVYPGVAGHDMPMIRMPEWAKKDWSMDDE